MMQGVRDCSLPFGCGLGALPTAYPNLFRCRSTAGVPFFLGCIAWNYSPALMGSLGPAMLRLLVMCGALLQVRFCCSLHSEEHGFNRQEDARHILTTAYREATVRLD